MYPVPITTQYLNISKIVIDIDVLPLQRDMAVTMLSLLGNFFYVNSYDDLYCIVTSPPCLLLAFGALPPSSGSCFIFKTPYCVATSQVLTLE